MLGLQSRDHAKKRKENTGKRLEGNIIVDDKTLYWFKIFFIVIVILMLTNITINRSYSIGSTSQLRSMGHKNESEHFKSITVLNPPFFFLNIQNSLVQRDILKDQTRTNVLPNCFHQGLNNHQ